MEYENRNEPSNEKSLAKRMADVYSGPRFTATEICVDKFNKCLSYFEKELVSKGAVRLPSGRILVLGKECDVPEVTED